MHYVIALFDVETGKELGRVTVDGSYREGAPYEDLLTSDSAHAAAYQYFAGRYADMEGTEVRRVSLTDTEGPAHQFVEKNDGRNIKL